MTTQGYGFGKVILFNEHFVVQDVPAIASAINLRTIAFVRPSEGKGVTLRDERNATKGYKEEKLDQQKESLELILKGIGIELVRNPVEITLGGDLTAASGIGASAASCAAIARALSEHLSLGLSDEQINQLAYEGEKGYHGSPSGIDNTVATFGGMIWFKRGNPNVIEQINIRQPFEVVIGNTGIVANTKAAVAGVKKRMEEDPDRYRRIFRAAEKLVYEARAALEAFDMPTVGRLMNDNHEQLQAIEVSCKELDYLVKLALEEGALGAKMTGGGLGGNMIALTPGERLQNKVAEAIEQEGFETLRTKVGIRR